MSGRVFHRSLSDASSSAADLMIGTQIAHGPWSHPLLVAVGVSVAGLAAAFATAGALSALGFGRGEWTRPEAAFRQVVVAAVSLAPLVAVMRWRREGLRYVGLEARSLVGIGTGLALSAVLLAISGKWASIAAADGATRISVLCAALAVGFAEEAVSRGYTQGRAVEWIGPWRGIPLASAIFGISHVPQRLLTGVGGLELLIHISTVMLIGLGLGVVMHVARNLLASSLVHAMHDALQRF